MCTKSIALPSVGITITSVPVCKNRCEVKVGPTSEHLMGNRGHPNTYMMMLSPYPLAG